MIPIRIFTRDSCQPCKAVKRWFDERGFKYTEMDVDAPENAQEVAQMGIRSLPVTIVGNFPVSGFAPTTFKAVLEDNGYVV